ncbi:MAG: ABC transporter permease [Acidobacteriota bacterium]|nr:ABC transporter permease [Acidobacteriota bacterium]
MRITWIWFFLRNLTTNRNLLKNLIIRDLKQRYVGSVGGFIWSFVHPVILLVCYTFVFSVVLRLRLDPRVGTENFPLYLFCGILPWFMFQDTVIRSCGAITDNAALITKTVIPAEILPIAITLSNLVHHLIGLTILMVALLLFHSIHLSVLWVLLYLPILIILAQGLGWLVSSLNVFFRDTTQVLNVLMVFWFWFTPVFYPAEMVPDSFRLLIAVNPMATLVSGYRTAFLQLSQPGPEQLLVLGGWTLAAFLVGALLFRRSKPAFADVL